VAGDDFISTMPLRELILALDPPPPPAVVAAARRLQYRDYLTIVLIVNREQVFPDHWIYVHAPEVRLGRIQNYKNWSPDMVPDRSRTALGLEYFLWDEDPQWGWSDDRLIALGIRECEQIGVIRASEVERGTVARVKKAYPLYDRGYQDRVKTVRAYLATLTNLQTIGRNGLHRYNNQDHSMLTGIYAARNVIEPGHDVWSVNMEAEYHEDGDAPTPRGGNGDRLVPMRVDG
jgi:protoporphyrinogen oxidase